MLSAIAWGMMVWLTQSAQAGQAWHATTDYPPVYDVSGFEWMSRLEVFRVFDGDRKSHTLVHSGRSYRVEWTSEPPSVAVVSRGSSWRVGLDGLFARARRHSMDTPGPVPHALLAQETRQNKARLRVNVEDISVDADGKLLHFKAEILFGRVPSG
jgi:hypothetical protein